MTESKTQVAATGLPGVQLRWGTKTYILAIINATPDSFSGDGVYGAPTSPQAAAVGLAETALRDGADFVDIGGVPTWPGAPQVSSDAETDRTIPVIRAIRESVDIPISVDTADAATAAAAMGAGAVLVNSCWGLRRRDGSLNRELASAVAADQAALVLTHNKDAVASRGHAGPFFPEVAYADLVQDIIDDLREQVDFAIGQGVPRDRLIVDYGLGMGKSPAQSRELFLEIDRLKELGLPILLAHSRKVWLGDVVGGQPADRDPATVATSALGIAAGVDMLRVHNVRDNKQAATIADALYR